MAVLPAARTLFLAVAAALALTACQTTSQTASAPQAQTMAANPGAAFTASVRPDGPTPVPLGQEMRFQVTSSQGGFANLYLLGASGQSVVLAENLPLGAGQPRLVPDPSTGMTLTASPPLGTDRVVLLVTTQPMAGILAAGGAPVTQPQAVPLSHQALLDQLNAKTARIPASAWAMSEGAVTVVAGAV